MRISISISEVFAIVMYAGFIYLTVLAGGGSVD